MEFKCGTGTDRSRPNVLIVDDDPRILEIQSAIWKTQTGIDVETRSDPLIALSEIVSDAARYDLLVTDVHMPTMDGRVLRAAVRGMVTVVLMSVDPLDSEEWVLDGDWEVMFVMKPMRKESVASILYQWEADKRRRTKRLALMQEVGDLRKRIASLTRTNATLEALVDGQMMNAPKPTMPDVESEFADTPVEVWKRKFWIAQLHHQVQESRLSTAKDSVEALTRRLVRYGGEQQHSERDLICVEGVSRRGRVWVGFSKTTQPHVLVKDDGHSLNAVRMNGEVTLSFETIVDRNEWLGDQEIDHEIVESTSFVKCEVCHLYLPVEKRASHVLDCSG